MRLNQQGFNAKLLGDLESSELSGESDPDSDEVLEKIVQLCEASLDDGFVPVLIEGCLDRSKRQQVQQRLRLVINVLIKSSLKTGPRDSDHEAMTKSSIGEMKAERKFEEPASPDMIVQAEEESLAGGISGLMKMLEDRHLLSNLSIEDEEKMLIQRLKELGYL